MGFDIQDLEMHGVLFVNTDWPTAIVEMNFFTRLNFLVRILIYNDGTYEGFQSKSDPNIHAVRNIL